MKRMIFLLSCVALLCACSGKLMPGEEPISDGDIIAPDRGEGSYTLEDGSDGSSGESEVNEQGQAGVITAGEWRDLDNWLFWSDLMTKQSGIEEDSIYADYTTFSNYWGFFTNNRVAVRVANAANDLQRDVPVQLVYLQNDEARVLYEARTDNRGEVSLWIGLTQQQQSINEANLALVVDGTQQQPVTVTHWGEETTWNHLIANKTPSSNIDIAFIVDATGSMEDEISFLKADLTNIISSVFNKHPEAQIRTAAVFYRDEDGDEYVTRESDFSSNLQVTNSFIQQQTADGGGDYPEAVHIALETSLQKLSWQEDNCIRLAFMLLDAPPHKEDAVIARLQKVVPMYAKKGIRIIPVAASGVDKPTEFFLRFIAIATDGTYVFLTNDSGVGNYHMAPTVGEYKVELLNKLIERLIDQYLQAEISSL